MTRFHQVALLFTASVGALSLGGCVDHDYDLSKDIDMNVEVGGDITIPASTTEAYTLAQIMDLSENSSIHSNGQDYGLSKGDYVVVQDGDPTSTIVSVPRQYMTDTHAETTQTPIKAVNAGTGATRFNVDPIVTAIHIADESLDPTLKSLSRATTDISVNFRIRLTCQQTSSATMSLLPGFSLTFPAGWTIEPGNASVAAFTRIDGNRLVFTDTKSMALNSSLDIPVHISAIDFSGLPKDQGLYAPGKFRLDQSITTGGPASFSAPTLPVGEKVDVVFNLSPSIPTAEILTVTGFVSPDVKVSPSTFAIRDIPDFLLEPGNNLDIVNPQIQLTVKNSSPVAFDISGRLMAMDANGDIHEVWIGRKYGTQPISVSGSGTSNICISRTGAGAMAGSVQQVTVPELATLIETIPQTITLDNVTVTAHDGSYTFVLGTDYSFSIDYTAVVPLAFGPELKFIYSTKDLGWDNDDLHKYSFHEAIASVDITNSIPLDLTPEVEALDSNGNVISDVTATVSGTAAAGDQSAPVTTALTVTLRSESDNLGRLDGLQFRFTGKCPQKYVGHPLNEAQQVIFTNIKLNIKGGIGIDLN